MRLRQARMSRSCWPLFPGRFRQASSEQPRGLLRLTGIVAIPGRSRRNSRVKLVFIMSSHSAGLRASLGFEYLAPDADCRAPPLALPSPASR